MRETKSDRLLGAAFYPKGHHPLSISSVLAMSSAPVCIVGHRIVPDLPCRAFGVMMAA
jgi:hypothetical protein